MKKLALFAALACASLSFGKGWIQPWTPKFPSFESMVVSCEIPKPYKLIAADDFHFGFDLDLTTINWWGTVTNPKQTIRPFYIAIYKESGNCTPAWDSIVWKTCVKPKAEVVGEDCKGNKVYKFYTQYLPGTLKLPSGKYWIQISESDKDSVKVDNYDFGWSTHDPVEACPALQMDYNGWIYQPLIDPCYGQKVDLAFEIY